MRSSHPTTPGTALRLLSGGGTPANNATVGNKGYIGFFLKVLSTDTFSTGNLNASVLIDDGSSATEQASNQPVIDDGNWHLYQWNLADANDWSNFNNGNGQIDSASATVDSIYFSSAINMDAILYLDTLAFNPNGNLSAMVPEPNFCVGLLGIFLLFPFARYSRSRGDRGVEGSG
jgi:hypothetical protein